MKQRGLFQRINLIVLSDHGMAAVPAGNTVLLDDLLPLDQVQLVSEGIVAGFNPRSDSAADRARFAAIERKLEQPQRHMRCWDKSRVPARLDYGSNPRVPQLICLADVHWRIASRAKLAAKKDPPNLGNHGYDNAKKNSRGGCASGATPERGSRQRKVHTHRTSRPSGRR
ncbi:hypothetical protein B1992_15350 [Pseudoxanthomonas broegbernensis]|uniref:Uncharacterized protein n=1 Tax=Pseudoxanthomonas broegbernensis TaxID=83619 RepID=A0A7V8GJX6_9GAMM|nr:hypothetical protein B1992_15350 [Pseudoxanthomonas broegbernensis]